MNCSPIRYFWKPSDKIIFWWMGDLRKDVTYCGTFWNLVIDSSSMESDFTYPHTSVQILWSLLQVGRCSIHLLSILTSKAPGTPVDICRCSPRCSPRDSLWWACRWHGRVPLPPAPSPWVVVVVVVVGSLWSGPWLW